MTCTLFLMRHAKSSWNEFSLADHDRPLNKRGYRSAKVLGEWLANQAPQPEQALVSSSTRTRETFAGLNLPFQADFTRSLYHANSAEMQMVLETATAPVVLMIGHNPGIAEFANDMVVEPAKHPRFGDFPTGATAVISFDIDRWDQVDIRSGKVLDFVVPRELLPK